MTRTSPLHATRQFPFIADWRDALFIHSAIEPARLAAVLPPELEPDVHDGQAYLSLVAFAQKRLRPTRGGQITEWLSRPLSDHLFLNLRTYVRCDGESGIFFLAEWIDNALAALLGPRLYGLPYRLGQLAFAPGLPYEGKVRAGAGKLRFTAAAAPRVTAPLDAFVLERYTAWTCRNGTVRRFRIRHEPWPFRAAAAQIAEASLLGEWSECFIGGGRTAHYSTGVCGVDIGPPEREIRN